MGSPDTGGDPRSTTTLVVGLVGALFMLAIVLLTQVLFYNTQRIEDQEKLYAPRPRELTDLQVQQLTRINDRRVVDPNEGFVAFPIDRAIEVYAAKVKSSQPPTTMSVPGAARAAPQRSGAAP